MDQGIPNEMKFLLCEFEYSYPSKVAFTFAQDDIPAPSVFYVCNSNIDFNS